LSSRCPNKIEEILKNYILIVLLIIAASISQLSQAQEKHSLIQVSGIITDDQKNPVPRATIISKKIRRSTISEQTGIYSLISVPGDTVYIHALGYKKVAFPVPAETEGKIYKKDVSLVSDTISIEGVSIFPWKSYGEFKKDFLANQVEASPQIRYMYENLASIQSTLQAEPSYLATPQAGYRMAMNQVADANYTRGQSPANNLLNPFAWARFFSGVKHGMLKNQVGMEKYKKTKVRQAKSKTKADKSAKS
jgi:hypothetical protein